MLSHPFSRSIKARLAFAEIAAPYMAGWRLGVRVRRVRQGGWRCQEESALPSFRNFLASASASSLDFHSNVI